MILVRRAFLRVELWQLTLLWVLPGEVLGGFVTDVGGMESREPQNERVYKEM